jgi:2-phosphoglycerate kinase
MPRMSASLYFVGGAALAGKSDVSTYFLKRHIVDADKAPQYVGTDALRRILWKNVDEEKEPALFAMHKDRASWTAQEWLDNARSDPGLWVRRQHAEEEVVWRRGVMNAWECNEDRGLPTLFEGVGVLPQQLARLETPHRAVFVANSVCTDLHRENVMASARSLQDHWMRTWPDEKIDAYLTHIMPAYAEALSRLAHEYGYPYFDLSQGDFREGQQEAARVLAEQPARVGALVAPRARVQEMGEADRVHRGPAGGSRTTLAR